MKKKNVEPQLVAKEHKLLETYETEIEFTCPVRGLVKQKVKVKRYQSGVEQNVINTLPSSALTDKLDAKYSGLLLGDDTVDAEEESGNNIP